MVDTKKQIENLKTEISKAIIGQDQLVDHLICGIISKGHILLEGVPGLAKTLSAKALSKVLDLDFKRVQFTPDLMPSDLIGTSVYVASKSEFQFKKGPLFTNVVLADEINRAPAKTQAALLEVMEEQQITVDGKTYKLKSPFLVIATQNPVEYEGVYRLPEAQLDRFMMKIVLDYPSIEEESLMLETYKDKSNSDVLQKMKPILDEKTIISMSQKSKKIHIEKKVIDYVISIVNSTRLNNNLILGASPRASIDLMNASKAFALINQRDFVIPEDVKYLAPSVLSHRIILSPEKEIEGVNGIDIIKNILSKVEVPR